MLKLAPALIALLILAELSACRPPPRKPDELVLKLDRGRPMVEVKVNGQAVTALLDTGAGMTVLNTDTAERLELKTTGRINVNGIDVPTAAATLAVGGLVFRDLPVAITPHQPHQAPAVVVGLELFHRRVVDIDPDAEVVRLYRPHEFRPPRDALLVPLTRRGDRYETEVILNGAAFCVAVDTGSTGGVGLSETTGSAGGLSRLTEVAAASEGLGNNNDAARLARVPWVGFAGGEVYGAYVFLHATDRYGRCGLLGVEVLGRSRLILDLANSRMWLATRTRQPSGMGMGLIGRPDGIEVFAVRPGSLADRTGVRPGDRLDTIDGRPVTEGTFPTLSPGQTIELGLRSGRKAQARFEPGPDPWASRRATAPAAKY